MRGASSESVFPSVACAFPPRQRGARRSVFSNCNCIWYSHSNCKRNSNKNSNGNGDIVLVMGETVLEQGERSKAMSKVKSCPRLPLRPQFR